MCLSRPRSQPLQNSNDLANALDLIRGSNQYLAPDYRLSLVAIKYAALGSRNEHPVVPLYDNSREKFQLFCARLLHELTEPPPVACNPRTHM